MDTENDCDMTAPSPVASPQFSKEEVQKFKEEMARITRRTIFTKGRVKRQLAERVSSNFDLPTLIQNSVYPIGEDKIFVDYTYFKLYGNPTNFELVVQYFMQFFMNNEGDTPERKIELHINLKSLSASACERYKQVIYLFFQHPAKDQCLSKLSKVVVYNTPSVVDMLCNLVLSLMKNGTVVPSVFYNVKESDALLAALFAEGGGGV